VLLKVSLIVVGVDGGMKDRRALVVTVRVGVCRKTPAALVPHQGKQKAAASTAGKTAGLKPGTTKTRKRLKQNQQKAWG
jgi:hypothetical protein